MEVTLGAIPQAGRTFFRVWAPNAPRLEVEIVRPVAQVVPMNSVAGGYHELWIDGVDAGARYFYRLAGDRRRPDPASRAQPEGVHGASEVVDPALFQWRHPFRDRPLDEYVIYELHVGTFTPAGTFDGVAGELDRLKDLGVTAIELMPVASFPGRRNWGYDGVAWFAPQHSYGGPEGLRRLVDACHAAGIAVILDAVYNHLGPEGNYLGEFGPYFTSRHHTPWGEALDYDGPGAAPVRAHVIENARMWVKEFGIDALRIDAVHAICDDSPLHIVAELADEVHALGRALGRNVRVIAESDLGDTRVIEPRARAGWDCDAQWCDDFHHAVHATVTGEGSGYYVDFGPLADVARAFTDGYVYTGQPSRFRGRPFGMPSRHLAGERFVIFAQNHDQVGNRALGERLGHLAPGCEYAAAAAYLMAPAVPLIFMGEEHADPAPFLYFTDHGDPNLAKAVIAGRRREFGYPPDSERVPDPQAPETFARSRINLELGTHGRHAGLRRFYRALLALRRNWACLRALDRQSSEARADADLGLLTLRRYSDEDEILALVSLSSRPAESVAPAPRRGAWQVVLEAGAPDFGGPAGAELLPAARAPEPGACSSESRLAPRFRLPPWGVLVLGSLFPEKQ